MSSAFGTVQFARRGLGHYRREHLLVAAATAVAVAVLVGALVVGDSVRGSLRAAFTERLGATDYAVLPLHAFSDDPDGGLAARLAAQDEYRVRFEPAAPIYRLAGTVVAPGGGTVPVTVFGVDGRYFAFHGLTDVVEPGTARVSSGVRRLGFAAGDGLLIRVGEHRDIAAASLFGEKEDAGVTIRREVAAWPDPAPGVRSGDFALFPGQGAARAVFLPIGDLRRVVDTSGQGRGGGAVPRANALLIRASGQGESDSGDHTAALGTALAEISSLDDRGLSMTPGVAGGFVLESRSLVLADGVVEGALAAAERTGVKAASVLTYLATSIRAGDRETPYSLVSGLPAALLPEDGGQGAIHPGRWLADDLDLRPGDPLELSFLVWEEQGRFHSETASFVAGTTVAEDGLFLDQTLAPEFPGVSDSTRMGDWDPPFPVDLSRIRDRDERYWEEHRTLPKAFVPLAAARPPLDDAAGKRHLGPLPPGGGGAGRGGAGGARWRRRCPPKTSGSFPCRSGSRVSKPPGARPTSGSISSTSPTSYWCRRSCCWRSSTGWAWSAGCGRSACCSRAGGLPAASRAGCCSRPPPWRSSEQWPGPSPASATPPG